MNRLRILLITTALLMGSSALASAEDFHHDVRYGDRDHDRYRDHDRDRDRDRDGDRDDRRVYVYPDHRWLDTNGNWRYDNNFWRFDLRLGWVRR